jgi:hypothetical protein
MDPATIGATVVTILAPYVADAGKEIVKTAGEIGLEKAKGLLGWLKKQFSDDPVAANDLLRFEKDPEKFADGLTETIVTKASTDPAFKAAVTERVNEFGPVLTVVQQFKDAADLVGMKLGTVTAGTMTVTQTGDKAKNVVGIDAVNIGPAKPSH